MLLVTKKNKFLIATLFSIVSIFVIKAIPIGHSESADRNINVYLPYAPYSSDPLEYDSAIHHLAFRSVRSSLVSEYSIGDYTGTLASSWISSNNSQDWTFKIRNGLNFENGDNIDAKSIVLSFTRLAYVLKLKGSQSEFFDNLNGIEKLDSPIAKIDGLKAIGNEIKISFKKPVPNLLDIISFGLYGISHSSEFEKSTGKWLNPKNFVSSGPYKIHSWTSEKIVLTRRKEFNSNIGHPKLFNWSK